VALDEGELSTAHAIRFTPGKESRYPMNRRLGEPYSRHRRFAEEIKLILVPGFISRSVQPVANSYTDDA
jgi:hypothetical protein